MGAYATDFVEKLWPPLYGSHGFSYLFEGNDPAAFPTNGYLWDAAARAGLSLRNYGEFTGVSADHGRTAEVGHARGRRAPSKATRVRTTRDSTRSSSTTRASTSGSRSSPVFVKKKEMPRLMIVRLGNDHTVGTKKGGKTPRAMVAENDVALGRLVEAVSHSPFWNETAIFVIEDDAQNGPDHVDAHRTVALVDVAVHAARRPWIRRCTPRRPCSARWS